MTIHELIVQIAQTQRLSNFQEINRHQMLYGRRQAGRIGRSEQNSLARWFQLFSR
jgi:hypothetical protein